MWGALMSRYSSFVCLAFSLALGAAACGDDEGGGDGALLSAFPNQGFVGRTTSVVLIGEDASFNASSVVDFGEGVTVRSTMAVGSNGLIVEIAADLDAAPGPRPVTVDGLTLADGFTLESPIEVEVLGTPAQGSYSLIKITNRDYRNPFDVTTNEDGDFTNLMVMSSLEGGRAVVNSASALELELLLTVDVNAAAGPLQLDLLSGPSGTPVVSRTSVEVTARTPMTAADGTISGNVANGYDSVVYEVPAEQLTAVLATVPDTEAGTAFLQVLGPSGSFTDPRGAAFNSLFGTVNFSNTVAAGEKVYIILWDGTDPAGYSYTFDVDLIAAPATITHAEPNETSAAAQAVEAPGGVVGGSFTSETDEDWYRVVIAAGDVGKKITAVTGGISQADPVIEIFGPDGTTSLGGPEDGAYFDRLTSEATTQAGAHYVKITSSDYGPTVPSDSDYSVVIGLE